MPENQGVENQNQQDNGSQQPGQSLTNPPHQGNQQVSNMNQAVETRVSQDNARLSKALTAIGIDPSSDTIDSIANGTMTKEQIAQMLVPQKEEIPRNPQSAGNERNLRDLVNSIKSGEITKDSFLNIVEGLVGTVEDITSRSREQELTNNYMNCMDAVSRSMPDLEGAPDEVVEAAKNILWAITNETAVQEGHKAGQVDAFLNPEAYSKFASQNAELLKKIITYAQGSNKAPSADSFRGVPGNNVGVIGAGQGGDATPPTRPNVTRDNMRKAAENYVRQLGITI